MPVKDVKFFARLDSGIAKIDVELSYINLSSNAPIECTFSYPIESDTVISNLICKIGDRYIEAKVKPKEEAKNMYID